MPPGGSPGAPHAFLAAATALAGVWLLVRFTGRYWTAAAAIVTAGFGVAVVALVRMYWDVPGPRIAVAVLVAVLVAVSAAPTIALRMANVPRQTFGSITGRDIFARAPGQPEDTVSPVEDGPPSDVTLTGEQVAAAARKSNTVLTGVLLGVAAVAVPAAWVAVDTARRAGVGAAGGARRGCRHSRSCAPGHFAIDGTRSSWSPSRSPRCSAPPPSTGCMPLPTDTAATLIAAGVALGIAALGLVAATVVPPRVFSPPVRKVVEYTEYILLALVVPFAAWALGLLQYIRYH